MPTIVANAGVRFDRDALLAAFKAQNIDGRVFFWPLSSLPGFVDANSDAATRNRVSYGLPDRAVNLPTYHDLTNEEMDRVIACVRDAYDR
jgi:perosamine synthetase